MNDTIEAPLLLALSDPRARDASLTGGKASALAALTLAGQPVPAGVVLTTAAFEARSGQAGLRAEARQQLAALLRDIPGPFAVRSSGVAEDLEGASFAGQYESVLDVAHDDVEGAALRCVASGHHARVVAYRTERGIGAAPVAVLVQQMVAARAAGVAFTAHPVTGERDVVCVSAVPGVGERLVSGDADAEEWEVRGAAQRVRGTTNVLDTADLDEIVRVARAVAGARPTDIEWAVTGDGDTRAVHVLQARPMTALPDAVRWDAPAPGGYFRNFRLGEWLGAPMTPVCASWVIPTLEDGLHAHFADLTGIDMPVPGHVVVNGWYFYGGLNIEMGPLQVLQMLPRTVRVLLSARRAELLAATPPVAHLGFDPEVTRWREELLPALRACVAECEATVNGAAPDALVGIVNRLLIETVRQVCSIVGVAGYAAKCEGKLLMMRRSHAPQCDESVIGLAAGTPCAPAPHDVEGLDPVFPTLGERGPLPAAPSAETRARVLAARDAAEARLLAAVPRKARARFVAAIAEARRAHAVRIEQTGLLTLGWPVLRRALLRLGAHAVQSGALTAAEEVFFLTRDEIAAAAAGTLAPVDVAARRAVWNRQRTLAPPLVIGTPVGLGKAILETFSALLHHAEHDAPDAIVGMPGSPGRVSGLARVVRSVDDLAHLKDGEILVAPVTTPAWTLAFSRAIAVVTDTGSVASHASIVAREHGIPAVVATGNATARVVDGQIITVDGGRGVVRMGAVA